MFITIDDILSVCHKKLYIGTESIKVLLLNGDSFYVSPLLAKDHLANGFGLMVNKYILNYEVLEYIINYNKEK